MADFSPTMTTDKDEGVTAEQTCDLCGGHDFEVLSNKDRRGNALTTGLCLGCGLVAHSPVPSEEEVAAYYAQDYRRDYHGEQAPSPRRIMRAWNNGQRIVNKLKPYLQTLAPEHAHVFEVGAGIGCTVKSFEAAGFAASGIEPNCDFNQYTREVLHAKVENTNLYDLPAKHDQDVVLLIHVIEHFVSPRRALLKIRELLKDDGMLYMECPNIGAPFATFGRLFHYAHIYNFTPATLRELARSCGFELIAAITDETHPDIRMLFKKVDVPASITIDAEEAARTREDVHRYGWLSYHLRQEYLARRSQQLWSYAREYMQAKRFVRALEKRFQS